MDKPFFAPQLYIKHGTHNIDFYSRAFGAQVLKTLTNEDGSIHVAELSIDGALFHLHEESERKGMYSPEKYSSATVLIGLFVADVDAFMKRALEAGAIEISPAQDYDYGYRQGELKDPFGHTWMIEMKI